MGSTLARIRSLAWVAVLLSFPALASAQDLAPTYEYGTTSELAGVRSVFIDCGMEMEVRANIIDVISKRVRGLSFASRAEDATVVLLFDASEERVLSGVTHNSTSTVSESTYPKWTPSGTQVGTVNTTGRSTARYSTVAHGEGRVFKVTDEGRARLLMTFTKETVDGLGRRPSTGFARRFAAAYLEANPDAAMDDKDKKSKKKGKTE